MGVIEKFPGGGGGWGTRIRYGCDPSRAETDQRRASPAVRLPSSRAGRCAHAVGAKVSVGSKIEEQPVYAIVDGETRVSASYSQAKRIHTALADTPPPKHCSLLLRSWRRAKCEETIRASLKSTA